MRRQLVLLLLVSATLISLAFSSVTNESFPIPTGVKNLLFYVQRSLNKNTIVYQLNLNENNELDDKEPINMFWVNYSGNGDIEPLNFIQKKYAYGLNFQLIDKEKKTYSFSFVSYKKQALYLIKSPDKKYHVYSYFKNKLILVNRIYVHIEGGSFWTPKVKYIEVSGRDPLKNEELVEKIII